MKLRASATRKLAKAKADKYFSLFIRLRDVGKACITCGRYTELQCGHFISRRFESVRFDEKNSNGQCEKCNGFEHGNQFQHGVIIDEMYGNGTKEGLLLKSKMLCIRKKFDYEFIAQKFNDKYNALLTFSEH